MLLFFSKQNKIKYTLKIKQVIGLREQRFKDDYLDKPL